MRRDDLPGKEALCRYLLRPPLAQQRVTLQGDGLVRIALKRPFGDGTTAVDLDPISLLCRLAASVPAPGFNTVRYGGVLAPAAKWRPLVIPQPPPEQQQDGAGHDDCGEHGSSEHRPTSRRSRYRPWRELLARTFAIDLSCAGCGKRLKLKAFVTSAKSLSRLCRRLGDPTEPPKRPPARGPPYFATQVVRRAVADQLGLGQQQLFEEG